MKGTLIVSLDFELNWGYSDKKIPLTEEAIREGLDEIKYILDKYQIHSTWAIVGQLFANQYKKDKEREDNLYQRYNWIERNLKNDPKVEIGSHTFSHLFPLEVATVDIYDDFQKMEIIKSKDYVFETIVFPRNQYNEELIQIGKKFGIKYFRGVKSSKLLRTSKFSKENKFLKFLKRVLELIPLNRPAEFKLNGSLNEVSDSRFFRFFPTSFLGNCISKLYYSLLKFELWMVIRKGKAYHIWFHPHNVISKPNSIRHLEDFFQFFDKIRKKYDAESLTIKEYVTKII